MVVGGLNLGAALVGGSPGAGSAAGTGASSSGVSGASSAAVVSPAGSATGFNSSNSVAGNYPCDPGTAAAPCSAPPSFRSGSFGAVPGSHGTDPLMFNETGLANGTYWYAEIYSGTTGWLENDSYTATIQFWVPTVTYYYFVESPVTVTEGRYLATPSSGDVTLAGTNTTVNITYTYQAMYQLSFNETGLPNGTYWQADAYNATFGGVGAGQSTNPINLMVANGSYTFNVYNATSGFDAYVPSPARGTVWVNATNTTINITFTPLPMFELWFNETGLPNGTNWTVSLYYYSGIGWQSNTSNNTSIVFPGPNGTYYLVVSSVTVGTVTYLPFPENDLFTLDSNVTVTITFSPGHWMTFNETGLPNNTYWWMGVDSPLTGWETNGTRTAADGFFVPNGTYNFTIFDAVNNTTYLVPTPATGVFTDNGTNETINITFAPAISYNLTFAEIGLPNGTSWFIEINNTPVGWLGTGSTGNTASFMVPNGTYYFSIENATNASLTYVPNPPFGYVTVDGNNLTTYFIFMLPYAVVFQETGLPSGTNWTIVWNGTTPYNSTMTIIVVPLDSGTYSYSIDEVAGYSVNPWSGNVTVTDSTVVILVTFAVPTITVTPDQGPVGASVVLSGSGFTYARTVPLAFDGVYLTSAACTAGNLTTNATGAFSCTLAVPNGTSGMAVNVTDFGGINATTTFWVTTPRFVFTPGQGPVGATVTVRGHGFSVHIPLASLVFDGVPITSCLSGSLVTGSIAPGGFSCTFLVPNVAPGTVSVVATDVGGAAATTTFWVTTPVIGFSVDQGPVGTLLTMQGHGFSVKTPIASLTFDGMPITRCLYGSLVTGAILAGGFSCTILVPSVTPGTVPVVATDVGGTNATSSFGVTIPRLVITPAQGPAGATVTVTGHGFSVNTPLARLVFDGVPITSCVSGSLITGTIAPGGFSCTFVVPNVLPATVPVSAMDMTGATGNTTFWVTVPTLVISPETGPAGTTVTVMGHGFSVDTPLASLVFDGVTITSCLSGSLTTGSIAPGGFSCTFLVPSVPPGTVSVTATDVGGTSAIVQFTVTP